MGIISSLFGTSQQTDEQRFSTLRDDGVRAMQMNELPYAEKCFLAALDIKADLKTKSFLAEVYLRLNNSEKALPLLQTLADSERDTLEIELLLAQTQGRLELYSEERETCTKILAAHPQEPRALYLMAEADHGLHDELMAIVHLTQCLAIRGDYSQAQYLRAEVLKNMGQWNEVLDDAEQLVKADSENVDYLLLRAEALAALARTDEAIVDYQKVQSLNPFCDEAILRLGKIYENTSQWDKALRLYDEAIEMRPDFAAAYKARGGVKNHLKDVNGAAEDLKRSLELAPEKAADYDGEYTNVENEMNDRYKRLNPYAF